MEPSEGDTENYDPPMDNERPAKKRKTSTHPPPREVGLMRSIPGDRFSSFVGSASGIYFIRSVYGAVRSAHPAAPTQGETPESDIVPGEDDHLPSVLANAPGQLWRDGEVAPRELSDIDFQELVEWSGSYFANWHPFYPYLHAPTILEYFEEISQNGDHSGDDLSNFRITILRSIMSISLADSRQSGLSGAVPYPTQLVFESYEAAVDSLQHVLSRPTTLQSLQAAISVQLFLVSMLRLNAASRLGGLVIRMALQLGLHRCPTRFPAFTTSEKEHRQRVFWSLYTIDRFICQSMGLPLSLHDDDVDVCYPIAERHPGSHHVPDDRLRLLSLLARQYSIRGQIIELRNKSLHYVQKDPDRATAITAQLGQWWNDIEDLQDNEENWYASIYHTTVLTVLKHEAIISLNRPALAASRQGPAYDAALQCCIGSARAIITTLHKATNPRGSSQKDAPLSLLWPSFTWAVWISTFILFHAASSNHISQGVVSRLADKTLDILTHLSRRGSVWPDASAAAVRDLRARITHRQSKTTAIPQNLHASGSVASGDNHASDTSTGISESLNRTRRGPRTTSTSNHPTDLPQEHPVSSTGITFSPTTPSLHPSTHPTNPFDGPESTQLYANASAPSIPAAAADPASNFTGFELGNTEWDTFMQGGGNGGLGSALCAGDAMDPYAGFDIPFWLGQDQYWDMVNERG